MDTAAPPAPAVLDLPPEFAAALNSPAGLRVRDPQTGTRFCLVPSPPERLPPERLPPERLPMDAQGDRLPRTLEEEVDEAIAQMDAGLGMTTEEVRAEMARRHPELRNR